jgi:tripartite-type tricarboxylate transporter receptor subunit TctC
MIHMHRLAPLALALAATFTLGTTQAQTYPVKPIRVIVPFAPGGGVDVTARLLAQRMSEAMGQQVIVENRAGAGGNIATELVARATPDGYTFLLTTIGHAIQPNLQKTSWDPMKDFAPVSLVVKYALIVAVNPAVPAQSLADLVAYAKANPGKLAYGSSGSGGPLHLATELFKRAAGIDIVHVPYKGNGPMTTALLAGEVQLALDTMATPLPHLRAGKLRGLAVSGKTRSPLTPDLPTAIEAGLPGYDFEGWTGMVAPAGTPREAIARMNAEIDKALTIPAVRERLIALGYDPAGGPPQVIERLIGG